MPVDFVKSDGGKNQPKRSGYDIEYTNPSDQPVEAKPKRGNLLSWFSKPRAAGYAPKLKTASEQPTEAKSATAPSAQVKGKASYQPITQPTGMAPAQSVVSVQPKAAAPLGVLTARQLPPAPLPPIHAAPVPVRPVATPVKTVAPQPQPVVRSTIPVAPTPIAPAPIAPASPSTSSVSRGGPTPVVSKPQLPVPPVAPTAPVAAAAPVTAGAPVTASAHHVTSVGQVVAQNVTGLHGQTSNPAVPHPNVVSLNLLPNAAQRPSSSQSPFFRLLRVGTLSMICLTSLYLAMVGYQAFYVWQTQAALQELNSLDATILGYRPLQADINTTSGTLEAVQTMLADHVYWTQWFTYLERYTLQSVHYTNFSGSVNGTMNLQASAPDFATVTQQIALFKALPEVTAIEVSTATRSDSDVQFSMSIQVDPAVLHYQAQNAYGD
ncbi:MAG: hypothetical protein HY565_03795 [Candidatus Kerfeldbacteria bacterium]|nr:hypothetical protein [Candidatus Kerfeldbacteria bacterium]